MNTLFIVIIAVLLLVASIVIPIVVAVTKDRKQCSAPLQLCGSVCYDPLDKVCSNGELKNRCADSNKICGSSCYDPLLERCIEGVVCKRGEELCGKTCYDPKLMMCGEDGKLILDCGGKICLPYQVCSAQGACTDPCVSTEPICDIDSLKPSTYCYFIGLMSPFHMFMKQRYWSADKLYYVSLRKDSLGIYNASNILVNQLVSGLELPTTAVVQFQEDANICVRTKIGGDVKYCSSIYCTEACSPQFNLVDGALQIIRDGKVWRTLGQADPRALIPYVQNSPVPALIEEGNYMGCTIWKSQENNLSVTTGMFALNFILNCLSADDCTYNQLWAPQNSDGNYSIRRIEVSDGSLRCYSPDDCNFSPKTSFAYETMFYLNSATGALNWAIFANLRSYWKSVLAKFLGKLTICDGRNIYEKLVNGFPYNKLTQLAFYTWPVRDEENIMRFGNGLLGESWVIFDTDRVAGLDGSFARRDGKTGCVARFLVDSLGRASTTVDFISLDNLYDIPDYSSAAVEPKGIVQDYVYYLFLARNGRKYPYLKDTELSPELLGRGQLYSKLVKSWLKYFSPDFQTVEQERRFNKLPTLPSGGSENLKEVRDYNLNTPAGVDFCNAVPDFCALLMKDVCQEEPGRTFIPDTLEGDADILAALKTYNVHVESDTCRRYFADRQVPERSSIISTYLRPFCENASSKFGDVKFRKCCENLKTSECAYVNSLFTKDGNCSCYIQSADLAKLYGAPQRADLKLNPSCYEDCKIASYGANTSYRLPACDSTVCIITQNENINVYNSDIGNFTDGQVACCPGADCKPKDLFATPLQR